MPFVSSTDINKFQEIFILQGLYDIIHYSTLNQYFFSNYLNLTISLVHSLSFINANLLINSVPANTK